MTDKKPAKSGLSADEGHKNLSLASATKPANDSEAAAVIAEVKRLHEIRTFKTAGGVEVAAKPIGIELVSLKPFEDERRAAPERMAGTSNHETLASFIAHVNQFKREGSAVFAARENGALTAIYDYGKPGEPSFNEHRSTYAAKMSRQWKAWNEASKVEMNQMEFAEFIEANVLDLIPPPVGGSDMADGEKAVLEIARLLNAVVAAPSAVIELARGLTVHEESKVTSVFDPASGQKQLQFVTEHKDAQGEKLKVPSLFLLGIPVYENDAPYRIVVRLRYRVRGGTLVWNVSLYEPEKAAEDAFEGVCENVIENTKLPLYRGAPDRS